MLGTLIPHPGEDLVVAKLILDRAGDTRTLGLCNAAVGGQNRVQLVAVAVQVDSGIVLSGRRIVEAALRESLLLGAAGAVTVPEIFQLPISFDIAAGVT